jgi:hypothetical protein
MPIAIFPTDIIEHYRLNEKVLGGYVYMKIRKGMYGLPQAGVLANKLLKERLARHGYFEQPHTPELWKMSVVLSGLASVWTTLALSILARKNYNTYMMRYERKHTKLLKTWKATYTVALP